MNKNPMGVRARTAVVLLVALGLVAGPEIPAARGVLPSNVAPGTPLLVSPSASHSYYPFEPQLFVIRAVDPDGDPYKGVVTLRNAAGSVIRTFETVVAPSDSNSLATLGAPMSTGQYSWSAHAVDALGLAGPESSLQTFTVNSVPTPGATQRVSLTDDDLEASGNSYEQAISGDGRYVAFMSAANNLVPGDTNVSSDIFVRDRQTGQTVLASVSSTGAQGNRGSYQPDISDNGRWVVFDYYLDSWGGSELAPGAPPGYEHVYLRDTSAGVTRLISAPVNPLGAHGYSNEATISADGRFIAYHSYSHSTTADPLGCSGICLHDRDTDGDGIFDEPGATSTQRVPRSLTGGAPSSGTYDPVISPDGRYVAYSSAAPDIVAGDTADLDVFLFDRTTGQTSLVSVSPTGGDVVAARGRPAFSRDARHVAFSSHPPASLGLSLATDVNAVFVGDTRTGTATRESVSSTGEEELPGSYSSTPSLSGDGRYVAFESSAPNLVFGDTNGQPDVFVRDRATGVTTRVSVDSCGGEAKGGTVGPYHAPLLTDDGRYAVFSSIVPNLVPNDSNLATDVFVHDRFADELLGMGAPVKAETPAGCPPVGLAGSDTVGLEDFYPYRSFDLGTATAYVNMATGNLVVQHTDLDVPGQGLNLRLTRTYNSQRAEHDGPLGKGWTLGVADGEGAVEGLLGALTQLDLGRVAEAIGTEDQFYFYDADGTRHRFVKGGVAGPGWHAPAGISLTMTDDAEPSGQRWYRLTRPDGVHYDFHPASTDVYAPYRLTQIEDRRGNRLTVSYGGDGRLSGVTDVTGRTISFTWAGSYLDRATFAAAGQSLVVDYSVDANLKALTSVTDAAGTASARATSYTYASGGTGLASVTDARGNTTSFTGQAGVVTRLTDRAGKAWAFSYGGAGCTPAGDPSNAATCLTDPEGNTSVWTTTPLRNLVNLRDEGDADEGGTARTNQRHYAWAANRVRQEVDEAGDLTEYEWNDYGQLTRVRFTGASDGPVTTTLSYRPVSPGVADLAEERGAAGSAEERLWRFGYDANGSLTSSTDPTGATTTFAYYARGLLKSVTDANNHTTTYGDTALVDGGYHASGQPTRVTDAAGAAQTFGYDFLGRRTSRVDRQGNPWSWEYDLRGNLTRETNPLGHATLRCYDANDNEVLVVRPRSPLPSCSLDGTDGYSTKRTYDARDLLASVLTASDGQLRKSVYGYYDDGQLSEILEPRSFDPASGAQLPTLQRASYLRYPNNRIRAFIDEEGKQTDFVYTPDGLPRIVTEPASSAGRHTTTYTYTGFGAPKTVLSLGHSQPTTYTYNLHGERTATKSPKGTTTTVAYDGAGRVTRATDGAGRASTRSYDPVGNLVAVTLPTGTAGTLTTTYAYTARDEIATESDPTDPAHLVEYAYDAEGNQTARADRYAGVVERSTDQSYDGAGRLTQRLSCFGSSPCPPVGASAGMHRADFGYDAHGNPTTVDATRDGASSPNLSTMSIAYTSADEPRTFTETIFPPTGPGVTKTSSFSYDQNGSLATRTVDGQATSYEHLLNGLERATVAGADRLASDYYDNGALRSFALPGGVSLTQTYDVANRLASKVLRRGDGTVLSSWDPLAYDENDNRTAESVTQRQLDDTSLSGASSFGYDTADRLVSAKHPFETTAKSYALDDAGNVTADGEFTYAYAANRLTSRQAMPSGSSFTYGYDHFGNLTSETGPEGTTTTTYDAGSHPLRITAPDGTWVEYAYDGLGRQVRRVTSTGGVELFFRDRAGPNVTLETDQNGTVKTRYVLDSDGDPLANDVPGTGRGYYVTDPRNNLTQLIDGGGAVKAVFAYDPFGKPKGALTNRAAGWDSRLRFQLAPQDPKTGQYRLASRLFDPAINRFVGADLYVGASANLALQVDPLTGNRYLYAGANPANMIDDGHAWCRSWRGCRRQTTRSHAKSSGSSRARGIPRRSRSESLVRATSSLEVGQQPDHGLPRSGRCVRVTTTGTTTTTLPGRGRAYNGPCAEDISSSVDWACVAAWTASLGLSALMAYGAGVVRAARVLKYSITGATADISQIIGFSYLTGRAC